MLDHILLMCQFDSLNRLSTQQGEEIEEDFSALDEPLPECTLAFTHGIGKQVTQKNKRVTHSPPYGPLFFPLSADPLRKKQVALDHETRNIY